jgi:hypothetical protein
MVELQIQVKEVILVPIGIQVCQLNEDNLMHEVINNNKKNCH